MSLPYAVGLLVLLFCVGGPPAMAQAQQPVLRTSVLSAGASSGNGGGVVLQSTLGQPVIGRTVGTAHQISTGFWSQVQPAPVVAVNNPPSAPQIIQPAHGTQIIVGGSPGTPPLDPGTPFTVTWTEAVDPDGDALTYTWQLATGDDFSTILLNRDTGIATRFETTLGAVADVLDAAGVALGHSLTLSHRAIASDGRLATPGTTVRITLVRGTLTAQEEEVAVPSAYRLEQNYPNPFNPSTTITYDLPQTADVRLAVYDLYGREVALLVDGPQAAGRYAVQFEAARLASGTYFYRIEAGRFQRVRRMMLVK